MPGQAHSLRIGALNGRKLGLGCQGQAPMSDRNFWGSRFEVKLPKSCGGSSQFGLVMVSVPSVRVARSMEWLRLGNNNRGLQWHLQA